MVNEKDIIEQQIKNQQAQEETDPLRVIEKLEEKQKADELAFQKRERELLIKIASQTEDTKASRKIAREAEQKAKVAEYKYLNQQKQEISGIVEMNNEETRDPQIRSRQIFVDRLKARLERSQRLSEEKKDNTYYI